MIEPVHPSRGQAVWVEATGDEAGTLVFCTVCRVADGKPSRLHTNPVTVVAFSRAEALGWAAEHAAEHRARDAVQVTPKAMPRDAHHPARRGRPRKAA